MTIVQMRRSTKASTKNVIDESYAECVGTAEFRGNLAKYLKRAQSGRPVIIQDRGRRAYVLLKLEEAPRAPMFGCMRERTEYVRGTIVNAEESWSAPRMP